MGNKRRNEKIAEDVTKKIIEGIDPKLYLGYANDDYSEEDMEEYGIMDIHETARFYVGYWNIIGCSATIIAEHIDISNPYLRGRRARENFDRLGISLTQIIQLEELIKNH